MMRHTLFLICMIVLVILAACTGTGTQFEQPPNTESLIVRGEILYLEYCAECHQVTGQGWMHLYPNLAGNPIVTLSDPEPIINTVLYGQGSMPRFNQRLNQDQLSMILSYIRNAWGNQAAAVSPRQIH